MPIRDFRCTACATVFEALVRDDRDPTCPVCGAPRVDRLISAPCAPGRSAGIVQAARRQALREGHLSHASPADRRRAVN